MATRRGAGRISAGQGPRKDESVQALLAPLGALLLSAPHAYVTLDPALAPDSASNAVPLTLQP